ncbi:MAG: TM2 domain-containing protein [Micrococcales bacterium]|nr:TM2 domain-containing protein [Micrococcales bacterium]
MSAPPPVYPAPPTSGYGQPVSDKSWLAALLLSIIIGELGIDRFYLGKVGTGILKLITLGGLGIWWIIDVVLIAVGKMTDGNGRPVVNGP